MNTIMSSNGCCISVHQRTVKQPFQTALIKLFSPLPAHIPCLSVLCFLMPAGGDLYNASPVTDQTKWSEPSFSSVEDKRNSYFKQVYCKASHAADKQCFIT
ncbi:unnamed protein product [Boreogadus saida]